MTEVTRRSALSPVHIGIILLTLVTAAIHAMLATRAPGFRGTLFLIDSLVYLLLLVAAFAPIAAIERFRPTARILLLAWAVATIVAWVISGQGRNTLGYVDKAVEVILVVLLVLDLRGARRTA